MGPKILHRPGLIRPTGSQGQSRVFGPIGSIPRSIADTRNIIVVKLIKSVIANSTDRKEGLRPLSLPYNEKIISKLGQSGYEKRHPVKKRLWPCPEGDRPGRWSFFAGCLLIIVLAADQKLFFVIVTKPFIIDFLVCAVFFKFFKSFVNSLL